MGQQQLLLLVLGIVIVGLAVVVGIQAFGENQKKANADALTNDAIRIASDAQAWNLKPTAFGGGNGSFTGLTLAKLGYLVTGTTYTNLNTGTATGDGFQICDTPGATFTLIGKSTTRDNGVEVLVEGTGPNQITTNVGDAASAAC